MALPLRFRLALLPLVGLTAMELALYHTLDPMVRAWGDVTALSVAGFGLVTFLLLTALRFARSFTAPRSEQGATLAALVWALQLPIIIAIVWIAEGPPVLADDSLWNLGVFGWLFTGTVLIPLIGFLSFCVGWILDRRRVGRPGPGVHAR